MIRDRFRRMFTVLLAVSLLMGGLQYMGNEGKASDTDITYTDLYFMGQGQFGQGSVEGTGYWDIYLTTNQTIPGVDWATQFDDLIVLVDGVEVNALIKKAGTNWINIFFFSTEMPMEPAVGTKFTLCAGESLGYNVSDGAPLDYGVNISKAFEAEWNGSKWVRNVKQWYDATITGICEDTHKSEQFWKIYLNTEGLDFDEVGYYLNMEIDGIAYRYFARKESKDLLYMEIPFSVLDEETVSQVVIKAGEYRSGGQYEGLVLNSDFAFYVSPYEVTLEGGTYAAEIALTLVPTADDSKNGKGFIVLTDVEDGVTPDGATWTSRIYAVKGSGAYRNGTFTDTRLPMVKVVENTYYVALQDVGLIAEAGEIFTIQGNFYSPELSKFIQIKPLTVEWTGTVWKTVSASLEDTGVDSDVNADSLVNVKDLMRLKRCDQLTGIPANLACRDVNGDSIEDINDEISIKKVLVGQIRYIDGMACGTPTFEEETMERCAYSSPGIDGEEGRLSDAEIDAVFEEYKAAGFTLLNSEFIATYVNQSLDSAANEPLRAYLAAAERNGLGVIVLSNYILSLLQTEDMETSHIAWREQLDEMITQLSKYKSFRGFMMADELSVSKAVNYQTVAGYLKENYPDLLLFSSQLPVSAYSMSSIGPDALTTNSTLNNTEELAYRDYIWNFAKESDIYTYDLYPLVYSEQRSEGHAISSSYSVSGDWYRNLRYVAEEKKEQNYGFETGITIQSCRLAGIDTSTRLVERYAPVEKADMGFLTYTAMAYGMESIHYFTYEQHPSATETDNAIADNAEVYAVVKAVNEDVDAFANVYLSFNWRDTLDISAGDSASTASSKGLASASVSGDGSRAFVGCMKDKDGFDGYMVVNAAGPRAGIATTVTLEFSHAAKAMVYMNGQASMVDLIDSTYTVSVGSGEGVFVIPLVE